MTPERAHMDRTSRSEPQATAPPNEVAPPAHIVEFAVEASKHSPCRSKRGVAIFTGDDLVNTGHNYKPMPFACDGSGACKATCRTEALHAEQHALLIAGSRDAWGADMLHVKTVDGALVPSGGPSCAQCSKLILASGINRMWLYEAQGWRCYDAAEFHRRSLLAQFPAVGRSSSGGEQPVDPGAGGSGEAQVTHMDSRTQSDPQATAGQNQPAPAFTPGPWTVFEDRIAAPCYEHPNCEKTIGWRNAHDGVLRCSVNLRGSNERSTEANAHLIAAAPDLYAALQCFVDRYVALVNCGDCGNWDPEQDVEVIRARAALAKAEGR